MRVCLEAMGFVSPEKLLLLALLVALVFGTKGLPAIARRAGKGIRETRDALGIDAVRDDIQQVRSTVTDPLGGSPPPDAPVAAGNGDAVSNRTVPPTT